MGLLDDAIREHLELKRRSGADPAVVEREELEALAPVYDDEHAPLDDDAGSVHAPDAIVAHTDIAAVDAHPHVDPRLADLGGAGQDTAELDMRAVLEEDAYLAGGAAYPTNPDRGTGAPLHHEGLPDEEPVEREQHDAPENRSVPEEIPGQERLSFE
jgi:hypothetical protein